MVPEKGPTGTIRWSLPLALGIQIRKPQKTLKNFCTGFALVLLPAPAIIARNIFGSFPSAKRYTGDLTVDAKI